MKLGLIGLPGSGKTTIFNALTAGDAPINGSGRPEPNIAAIDVLDGRVEKLRAMYNPKKTTYATMEFVDYVIPSSTRAGMFSGETIDLIKRADALAIVLRNFPSHGTDADAAPDPLRDLSKVHSELVIADLLVVEARLERIEADKRKAKTDASAQVEERALLKLRSVLEEERLASGAELHNAEDKAVRGLQLLSRKPVFAVLNSADDVFGNNDRLIADIAETCDVIEFAGNFEMELTTLSDEDAAEFMHDIGISESARARLTTFAYRKLGYISFFTVGEDEVRAWTIRNGQTAVEAAGSIHSDLAKGFIRAECFAYTDMIELGSEHAVKRGGKFRLEGKSYQVADGDILSIRFSV